MRIVLDSGAIMPTRARATDAGYDLYAREQQIVPARESACFDIGVHIEIPAGYVESPTTVYNLRNKAVAEFALLYYGASALPSI